MPERIDTIIFDMDGVLVDSEPVHARAWTDTLAELGLLLKENWYREWFGFSDQILAPILIERYKLSVGQDALVERKYRKALVYLEKELEATEGLSEAIRGMRKYRLGLCTSSQLQEVRIVLKTVMLENLFEVIVSSNDVMNRKPSPDSYLLAADRLNATPASCLVVEDTHIGIRAAKSAGMRVIAVRTTQDDKLLRQADMILDTTLEAVQWIQKHADTSFLPFHQTRRKRHGF